jgi:hypothetical protein
MDDDTERLLGAVYFALLQAINAQNPAVATTALQVIAEHSSPEDARILNSIASKSAGYSMNAQPKNKEI